MSVEEIEDKDNLCSKEKEELNSTGPIFESIIPAD
jgi:hypothetical protein